MECVLTRLGLGPVFLQLLGILYKYPKATIKIGIIVTNHISITRGTKQGCPLSPILYAMIAEPLAAALREYHGNKGIRLPGYELIISTYADDTLLYIRDPERHLSPILREVVRFGCMSGLCVNWSKSIIFPITPCTSQFEPEFPLQWSTEAVRYLGIWVHTDAEVVLKENYGVAMGRLEDEVEKWIKLPLSLMGRISLMKMVVLPRLLFLFTNIPMVLPKVFFHRLTSLMIRLAWAGKQAKTSWQVLTLPYRLGGLGAPDFELYYRVAQAAQAYNWIHGSTDIPHIRIERLTADPLPLPALLFQHADRRTGVLDSINSTSHAWHQLLQMQAGALLYSPATPLEWCQWLPSCRDKGVIAALNTLGLHKAGDLFLDCTAKTWSDIDTDNNTPTLLTHFQFHRKRHALRDILGEEFAEPPEVLALTHMINAKSPARMVSKLYQLSMAHRAHTYTKAR